MSVKQKQNNGMYIYIYIYIYILKKFHVVCGIKIAEKHFTSVCDSSI